MAWIVALIIPKAPQHIVCEFRSATAVADLRALDLLEKQLERCGPENLRALAVQASCGCGGSFLLGLCLGSAAAAAAGGLALWVYARPREEHPRSQQASLEGRGSVITPSALRAR